MARAPDVHICEVASRDGLQNLDIFVPTEAKCALIDTIAAAGVTEIDAGSFVPPKVVPQFADVDAVIAHALTHKSATIGALVPNPKGAERAIAAGVNAVYFVISASETPRQCAPLGRRAGRGVPRGPRRDRRPAGGGSGRN
ncbi:hypothetical protein ML401_35605 (plasmid) [Bradyrhizobium sp. 62B]|uniref:hypothetical protein n=1 Tax=Bradyrhizobium sp. 62B TaxID=2898442 RepID=UPI002558219C|nr:hypothetical protein ML401_35605 [Bradyrhizobium sp. 62B]